MVDSNLPPNELEGNIVLDNENNQQSPGLEEAKNGF